MHPLPQVPKKCVSRWLDTFGYLRFVKWKPLEPAGNQQQDSVVLPRLHSLEIYIRRLSPRTHSVGLKSTSKNQQNLRFSKNTRYGPREPVQLWDFFIKTSSAPVNRRQISQFRVSPAQGGPGPRLGGGMSPVPPQTGNVPHP